MAPEDVVSLYCEAWDETDAVRRHEMLRQVWDDGGTYTDPTVHLTGTDELVEHIGNVQRKYPGSRIERTSRVDVHHGMLRFTWRKVLADGTSLPEGIDFGELSPTGKLCRIVGFFGPPAARR
jgi:hypothetical protein